MVGICYNPPVLSKTGFRTLLKWVSTSISLARPITKKDPAGVVNAETLSFRAPNSHHIEWWFPPKKEDPPSHPTES